MLSCSLLVSATSGSSCLGQPLLPQHTVRTEAMMIGDIVQRDSTQRIFPDMYFSCSGILTKWIIGGEPRNTNNPLPELQLWRTVDGTNYLKINFSLISTVPNITSDANVYEYALDPPLEFQEGDIFGLFKPTESNSVLNIFLQRNSGPYAFGQQSGADTALSEVMANSAMPLGQNDLPMVSVVVVATSKWHKPSLCIHLVMVFCLCECMGCIRKYCSTFYILYIRTCIVQSMWLLGLYSLLY